MRNLKRVLSLTLASVMLLGMMVVGSSAAQGYSDVDAEDNVEAIEVLQAVGVMVGDADSNGNLLGTFRPNDSVTRGEMARIMADLLDLDYDYYEAVPSSFTDVTGNYAWTKKFVDACAANGIVSGRGNGIYDPGAEVTAVEAASMMMRALGYFQNAGDYKDGFEISTVRQASQISLFRGINGNAHDALDRNQVAQLALNTLESNMVNFTGDMGWEINGVSAGYRSEYSYRTGTEAKYSAIHGLGDSTRLEGQLLAQGQYYINLGEQLYDGDLKLYDPRVDDFGRPARHWEYDGQTIGTYIKKDLLKQEYTAKVTGKDLYDLLGSDTIKEYEFEITIDGVTDQKVLDSDRIYSNTGKNQYYFNTTALNRTNTNQVGGTGNGVLTQVFVDGNAKQVYIAIINTYLAKANADYNESKNEVDLTVYNIREVTEGSITALVKDCGDPTNADMTIKERTANVKVYGEDFDVTGVEADDICLVHVAGNEIKEIFAPETIDDTDITAFKTDSYVVAGGNQIDYAHTAMYDVEVLDNYVQTNMKDVTYRVFLDAYGYLIGLEEVDSELYYVFLTGINSNTENLKDQTAIGNVVFLDGTSQNITINMKDSKNAQNQTFNHADQPAQYDQGTYGYGSVYTNIPYVLRHDTTVSSLMNTWCTYSVDDNGVYTLKEVPNDYASFQGPDNNGSNKIGHGQSHMGGVYYANRFDKQNGTLTYAVTGTTDPTDALTETKIQTAQAALSAGDLNDEYLTINKSNVRLDGIPGTRWTAVYGNNDSIYLAAETEFLSTAKNVLNLKNGMAGRSVSGPAVIITGAESVSVGVQDVDIQVWNAVAVVDHLDANDQSLLTGNADATYADVSDGVYTLFDKNGYVIAAMVVGSDDDANVSYAWVSSTSMNREALVNGKWEYSRDVIIDGVKTTLTEIESSGNTEPTIDVGQDPTNRGILDPGGAMSWWWEVKLKADGTVKEARRITANPIWGSTDTEHNYVYDINDDTRKGTTILNQSFNMNGVDTDGVLTRPLYTTYVPQDTNEIDRVTGENKYTVRVTGNTLQVEGTTGNWRGFAVSENAKIVVVKDERVMRSDGVTQVGWNYKGDVEYFTNDRNGNGLKQAVNHLNDSTNFYGYVAGVLKDGRAETLIIYDKTWANVNVTTVPQSTNDVYAYEFDTGVIHVWFKDDPTGRVLTAGNVIDVIEKYLTQFQNRDVEYVRYEADTTTPGEGKAYVKFRTDVREAEFAVKVQRWTDLPNWSVPKGW